MADITVGLLSAECGKTAPASANTSEMIMYMISYQNTGEFDAPDCSIRFPHSSIVYRMLLAVWNSI